MISEIKAFFEEWIAAVARAVDFALDRYAPRRQILLTEAGDQTFTASLKSMRKGLHLPEASFRLSHGRPEPALPAASAALPPATGASGRVKVFAQPISGAIGRALDVPSILRLILLGTGLTAATSMMVATYVGGDLDSEQQQLVRRISERRASLR